MTRLRWAWSDCDLRGDGRFPKDRLKGKYKRYIRKWTLRKLRKERERE